MGDRVVVSGLEVRALIGCSEEERSKPQPLTFNIEIGLAKGRPKKAGHLAGTVCWSRVREAILAAVAQKEWILVEDLAEDMAQLILEIGEQAEDVSLEVRKRPFIDVEWAGVQIRRSRGVPVV